MFGYIRLNKPECKMREYEYYRAVYCGLCRSLGRCTGQCSRMTLSYDMTFMALVRLALEEIRPTVKRGRCLVHPLRARPMVKPPLASEEEAIFSLCACATVLLSYHKIKDDENDERGSSRVRAALLRPLLAPLRRRANKRIAGLEEKITERLAALAEWERGEGISVDRPAQIFGDLLADLLSFGLEGASARLAETIGRHIGKWIYLADAADDYEEDLRRGRYNPLIRAYGEGFGEAERQSLLVAMTAELCEAEKSFDLLNYPDADLSGVIKNIIYLGMPQRAEALLLGGGDACAAKGGKNERSV